MQFKVNIGTQHEKFLSFPRKIFLSKCYITYYDVYNLINVVVSVTLTVHVIFSWVDESIRGMHHILFCFYHTLKSMNFYFRVALK